MVRETTVQTEDDSNPQATLQSQPTTVQSPEPPRDKSFVADSKATSTTKQKITGKYAWHVHTLLVRLKRKGLNDAVSNSQIEIVKSIEQFL